MSKVLVAEDDRHVRELLVDALFDAGYDVIEAKDGEVALEKATQERPDLVLLDIWMPRMDGFEVLGKLREDPATESVPVVLLTALPAIQGEQTGLELGALHYITKPWAPGIVEATVRVALRESRNTSVAQEDDSSAVWAGSTSFQRGPDDPDAKNFIRSSGALTALEAILGGGISLGTLSLIEGATTAGKSVFSQHLSHGALVDGYPVAYFTSEHTARSLAKQMGSIGIDVSQYVRDDRLSIFPVQEPTSGEDSSPLLAALALDIDSLPKKTKFVIVDSVTNLAGSTHEQDILAFFTSLRRQCARGRTIAVVVHSYAFADSLFVRLRDLCDASFRLRSSKIRSKLVRTLEVIKGNGIDLDRDNMIVFEVEAGSGIRIIPFSRAKV
jgi:flagellar protein FlaH